MPWPPFRTEPDDRLMAAIKELPPIIHKLVDVVTQVGGRGPRFAYVKNFSLYYLVLSREVFLGAINAAELDFPRVLVILSRSLFEYCTKCEFLISNPDVAVKQHSSLPARRYRSAKDAFSKEHVILKRLEREYIDFHLNPKGKVAEDAGDIAVADMAQKLYGKRGAYAKYFVIPSIFVHGFPEGIVDVIETNTKKRTQNIHLDSAITNIDALLSIDAYHICRCMLAVSAEYKAKLPEFRNALLKLHPLIHSYAKLDLMSLMT